MPRAASDPHDPRDGRTAPYGVEVEEEELVSDFLAGVVDADSVDELVVLDEPESPFFDSVVDVAVDGVFDDDLPRLSVL